MPSLAKKLYDEGLEDGLQEGLQEGKLEAMKTAVIDLIEVKFGSVDPGLVKKVQAINDLNILERLRHAVKTAKSLQDLMKEF